jgi:hypothetical protein
VNPECQSEERTMLQSSTPICKSATVVRCTGVIGGDENSSVSKQLRGNEITAPGTPFDPASGGVSSKGIILRTFFVGTRQVTDREIFSCMSSDYSSHEDGSFWKTRSQGEEVMVSAKF